VYFDVEYFDIKVPSPYRPGMADPIIRVDDVAFPRFRAPDLDEMERFLRTFGMHPSDRTDDALYMRGSDADHHVHVTHRGEPAFLGLAFASTAADLRTLAAATGTTVDQLDEPGGGSVVRLTDPDGRVVAGVARSRATDRSTSALSASGSTTCSGSRWGRRR
jgi:catechol 2,3-dioxygenase-like lactoylglutathione lyase family enzyme